MGNKTLQKWHLFIIYKFTNLFLTTLQLGCPGSRVARLWICKFVNNKQMAFLQIFVSQQLLFLFSKHLDTMSNVTDCGTGRTDLWMYSIFFSAHILMFLRVTCFYNMPFDLVIQTNICSRIMNGYNCIYTFFKCKLF